MAITFPRALPAQRFRGGSRLWLDRHSTRSPTRGGLVQVAELGAPLWRARYETVPVERALGMAWEAWLDSLRAGAFTFRATHPFRRFASAYPNGYAGMTRHAGGAFTGDAVLDGVGVARDTVTLSGLPSTFVLSAGDHLAFVPAGTKQAFHRIVEGATAVNGVATVAVEPIIRPSGAESASPAVPVSLGSPWFKAVLEQSSISTTWDIAGHCQISFEAWQTLS